MQRSTFIAGAVTVLTTLAPWVVQAEAPGRPSRWVQADDVRVRAGPSMEARIIGTLSRGAQLILRSPPHDDFCLIEGDGYDGYVACRYLSAESIERPRAGANGVDAAQRWVSGSGVTLRDEPRLQAAAVSRLSLNTVVQLLREEGGSGYCAVQPASGPGGYTACRYLAPTPVVVAHIRGYGKAEGALYPDYDPERAFWMEPSWNVLVKYARDLARRQPGTPPQGPWPRNDALERMKAHLALGLKGPKPLPYADWSELKHKAQAMTTNRPQVPAGELNDNLGRWGFDVASAVALVQALEFPSVKPSLFLRESEIAPPGTTTEDASGRFDIVYRQLIAARPKPPPGNEAGGSPGLYDMLARTQTLVRPVQRVQLFRDGRLRAKPDFVRKKETFWNDIEEPMCFEWSPGFVFGDADASIWRFFDDDESVIGGGRAVCRDSLKRNPAGSLFAFYTRTDLPRSSAVRTETAMPLDRDATGLVRGVHLHYDLNADGIPDLAVWEGQGKGQGHLDRRAETDDGWFRLVLVNIAGQWKILGSDMFGYGCGC